MMKNGDDDDRASGAKDIGGYTIIYSSYAHSH